jgi:hypothetical protein
MPNELVVPIMQIRRIRYVRRALAAAVMALLAAPALAQTEASPLDLRLHELPLSADDVAPSSEEAADTGTEVHGSFTTGIGYSKNFGNSTYNAAELDVSKQTDSGRVVDLHIGVQRTTGLPYASPPDYIRRYPDR